MGNTQISSIFLDTSVMIASDVHGPKTKDLIRKRLQSYNKVATSLVVRQEYKRRLLKEADYLLRQLDRYKSLAEVQHKITHLPDKFWSRKKSICNHLLAERLGKDDAEATERLKLYLHSLLVNGLKRFDQKVDAVIDLSGCSCGIEAIKEKVPLKKYEFGSDKCSDNKRHCGIKKFIADNIDKIREMGEKMKLIDEKDKSREIQQMELFISKMLNDLSHIYSMEPCLEYGDLIIALESQGIDSFYTLNSQESKHLARMNRQNLIVLPIDPFVKDEIVCNAGDLEWPEFNKKV